MQPNSEIKNENDICMQKVTHAKKLTMTEKQGEFLKISKNYTSARYKIMSGRM